MSMSQLKTPDEEWNEIWQNVHWYHLPLIILGLGAAIAFYALTSLFCLLTRGKK